MSGDIREAARKRIKARRDFWYVVIVFVMRRLGGGGPQVRAA
jgi:hypothetical protein